MMNAKLLNLKLKPDPWNPAFSAIFDDPQRWLPERPHYELVALIHDPTFIALSTDTNYTKDSIDRTEHLIERAVDLMFTNPLLYDDNDPFDIAIRKLLKLPTQAQRTTTERTPEPMASFLRCDQCKAESYPSDPGPHWREVTHLHAPSYGLKPLYPQHFCSDQCQANFILQTTDQPLVLTPRKR